MSYTFEDVADAEYNPVSVLEAAPMANGAVGVLLISVPASFAASHESVIHFTVNSESEAAASSVQRFDPTASPK